MDPAELNQVLMDVLTRVRAQKRVPGEQVHVVLDGKTFYEFIGGENGNSAQGADGRGERKRTDSGEGLPHPLLLQGRIISADALYTQKSFCQ